MKNKIKVLNILTGGLRREGISSTQLELIKHMNKSYITMDYVATHNNDIDVINEFKNNGCNVYEMPDRKKHLIKYIRSMRKLIKMQKYDIVHVHGSSSLMCIDLLVAKYAGVKVRIAHSRNTMCMNNKLHKLLLPFFRKSYNKALACGEDAGNWLFRKNEFLVFHNGKDLEKFKYSKKTRDEIRKKYHLEDKFTIGFVGKLNYQKNLNFLIDVFIDYHKSNSNSSLVLIGYGELKDELEEKVRKNGITDSVIFTGGVNNVNELLQGMDVMLLPSLYEGLPNVVLEWEASGLPCIISNTVTKECKVYDYVSFLPIDEGTTKWCDELSKIFTGSLDRNKLSQLGCKRLVENGFEINSNARIIENIYQELFKQYYHKEKK